MGKKRAYKSRKPGGGRKKLKPEYDAGKNLKEQMESAVALHDSKMSLQAIGEELGLNPIKVTSIIVSKMYPDYDAKGKLDVKTVGSINGRIKDLFIAKLGGVVLNSADTIVISAFLGLTLLAVYQNYYFVMSSVCGIMEILLTSITAGLGNSYITENKEKNYTDLKKITFMFFWLTGMCTSCFLGIFQPFMRLWVGEKFLMGFSVVVCLCVYFYLYETTRLLNVFKNAGGIWHEDRFRPLISAIVNLVLNLISVNYIGIYGIVLSTIVALAVIEIPWLLQNIFTVMYDASLFKDYFKMFVSWIIATVFSCVIIAVGRVKSYAQN